MKRTYPHHLSRAFTLLELLVVIAIIALLAGIALPALSGVLQSSKEAKNISNLKQICAAEFLYANDNNNKFSVGYNNDTGVTWADLLGPYVAYTDDLRWKSKDSIFRSPTAQRDSSTAARPIHYAVHDLLCGTGPTFTVDPPSPFPRLAVNRPSEIIFIADCAQANANGNAYATFYFPNALKYKTGEPLNDLIPATTDQNVDTTAGAGYLRYRNRDSVNTAMLDGSARSFKRGTVKYRNVVVYRDN